MSNVVLGYPATGQPDYDWIQHIRKTEDRLFDAVEPHFTFVFPTSKLSVEELALHTELKSKGFAVIHVRLTKAVVVKDDSVMQKLADRINRDGVNITGTIEELTIASYNGKRVNNERIMALEPNDSEACGGLLESPR
jgi:hypothetical protein